jgi:hypothetical protein
MLPNQLNEPAWRTALSVIAGYSLILVGITLVAFVVPWLLFTMTGLGV